MERANPPQPDELELSVFGRGVGESIALHLGDGQWAVFDSCFSDDGQTPAVLEYFAEIGVDSTNDIRLVAATHWHDDHIGGLSQILSDASSAKFACSVALRCEDFITLVTTKEDLAFVEATTGIDEFYDILEILQQRNPSRFARGPDHWCVAGMCVYRDSNSLGSEIHCVSPSSHSVTDGLGQVLALLPQPGDFSRRFPDVRPNEQSMAVVVKSKSMNLLLGADLEIGRDDHRGWRAVVNARHLPHITSLAHKIPHHGSPNAYHEPVWKKLLEENPVAVVTAYKAGRRPLPSKTDIERILSQTPNAYCTSSMKPTKIAKRRGLEQMINTSLRSRRVSPRRLGHVRLRCKQASQYTVELFGDARELRNAS